MKKYLIISLVVILLVFQFSFVNALTSGDAKIVWQNTKVATKNSQALHRQAKLDYAADKNPENEQKVVVTAKDVLNKALDEAEAWLNWKELETDENPLAPPEIKNNVKSDVAKNLDKIKSLKKEVDGIDTQLKAVVVFLKMVGSYVELVTDVARNVGSMWVHIGNELVGEAEAVEKSLRQTAEKMDNNSDVMAKLDTAKSEISKTKNNVNSAKEAYQKVVITGTPLIKFNEGNSSINAAKSNLLLAQRELSGAYNLIITKK